MVTNKSPPDWNLDTVQGLVRDFIATPRGRHFFIQHVSDNGEEELT